MDLSTIEELLDTFATFAGAIGDFLQKPAEFAAAIATADFEALSSTTADAVGVESE